MAKLTGSDVVEIRRRRLSGEVARTIAADYGIDTLHVYNIASRKTWKHVP